LKNFEPIFLSINLLFTAKNESIQIVQEILDLAWLINKQEVELTSLQIKPQEGE